MSAILNYSKKKNGEFKNKGFHLGIFFNIDQTHYTSNSKLYDLFFNS